MANNIEGIDVNGILVDGHWDSDDELCVDLGTYSSYLGRADVEMLRDHLTKLLEQ